MKPESTMRIPAANPRSDRSRRPAQSSRSTRSHRSSRAARSVFPGLLRLVGTSLAALLLAACPNPLATNTDSGAGKTLLAFSFVEPAVTGIINHEAGTIEVLVPIGTDRSSLTALFSAPEATVKIGAVLQTSGQSVNDFSSSVTYTLLAPDGSMKFYMVTVSVEPDTGKAFDSFAFKNLEASVSMDSGTGTITAIVPYGTIMTALVPVYETSATSVKVQGVTQVSGTTANSFIAPVSYTLTAGNGSTAVWTVTVSMAPDTAKAITVFSFTALKITATIDEELKTITATLPWGTDTTRLVAAFMRTGTKVSIGPVTQMNGRTVNDFSGPLVYTVHAADGSTADYTVSLIYLPNPAKSMTSFSITVPGFPDLSVPGTVNETARTLTATVPYGTIRNGLVAAFTTSGTSVAVSAVFQTSGVTPNDFSSPVSYTVTGADGLTRTYEAILSLGPNPAKTINSFSIPAYGINCTINEGAKTITGTLPYGAPMNALMATFTTDAQTVQVIPGPVTQNSGVTPNDFRSPVTYVITAFDGGSASYTVTLTMALNPAKAITSFSLDGGSLGAPFQGTINEGTRTITAWLPFEADLEDLVATFTTTGASVTVGEAAQTSGTTHNDFSDPLVYTVTAADGSSSTYTVIITKASAATPVITESGTYPRTITMSCATPGVTIYYSTDGSIPAPGYNSYYITPLTLNCWGERLDFKAVAYDAGNAAVSHPATRTIAVVGPELTLAGTTSTIAGNGSQGWADGTGTAATFYSPAGMTSDGTNLYIVDTNSSRIRTMNIASGVVTTLTGSSQGEVNGTLSAARFIIPTAITFDGDDLYVIDGVNSSLIRKINLFSSQVTTFAGSATLGNPVEGAVGTDARFRYARGLATDGDYLYVADTGNNVIQRIGIHIGVGESTIFAGNPASDGTQDGPGATATFSSPLGLATDGTWLYVAEGSGYIRRINLATREVSTLAGQYSDSPGIINGIGGEARFYQPWALILDGPNLYVADSGNNAIRKVVIATGEVSTLAASGLSGPRGISSNGTGLFVSSTNTNIICEIE